MEDLAAATWLGRLGVAPNPPPMVSLTFRSDRLLSARVSLEHIP